MRAEGLFDVNDRSEILLLCCKFSLVEKHGATNQLTPFSKSSLKSEASSFFKEPSIMHSKKENRALWDVGLEEVCK